LSRKRKESENIEDRIMEVVKSEEQKEELGTAGRA
jgi:hypothetical protein